MIFCLALTGPTASGKTALSLPLARHFGCEILSCDSMQVYRGMDIGTAKATAEERAAVPHHLLDLCEPTDPFSVQTYRTAAIAAARGTAEHGHIPLFVGGTGLYIDAVMRGAPDEVPESSRGYRDRLLAGVHTEEDADRLWQRLLAVDPESAALIHKNNLRRVIRALEIYDTTGKPKSYFDKKSREGNQDLRVRMLTLDIHDRETLYRRCDRRVDEMVRCGLFDEVRSLAARGALDGKNTASQAIGYKEVLSCLAGDASEAEAIDAIRLATRRYAKRQLTWFRHEAGAVRIFLDTEDGKEKPRETLLGELTAATEKILAEECVHGRG